MIWLILLVLCAGCNSSEPAPGKPVPHITRERDLNYQEFGDYDEEDHIYHPPGQHRLDINEIP